MKSERKSSQSNHSQHSKTQETVDTAPFVIDSPVRLSPTGNVVPDNEDNIPSESVKELRQETPEFVPRATPVLDPGEKIVDDE